MVTNPHMLDHIDSKQLGELLVEARKKAGLTQAQAADILGVARTTITAIEAGERRIRPFELTKLATAYRKPFASFVRPRPALQPLAPQFRASWRLPQEQAAELEQVLSELDDLLGNFLELYRILDVKPSMRYVPEYPTAGLSPAQAAETIASAERNRLGLGDGPITGLRNVLEQEAGIHVLILPLPGWCSGLYVFSSELGAVIAVSSKEPTDRQRMTLAHEYAHFLTSRTGTDVTTIRQELRLSNEERIANEFAIHFLMPASSIKRRVASVMQSTGALTARALIDVAAYFGVSVEALLRWLEDLRVTPAGTAGEVKRSHFAIRRLQEEADIELPSERAGAFPLVYEQLAFEAFRRGKITEGRFAELLRMDRLEARRLTRVLREECAEVGAERDAITD